MNMHYTIKNNYNYTYKWVLIILSVRVLRFKINHSPRPTEITHWVNFKGNKAKEIKELSSRNEEKRKRKKKRVGSLKNWDPKTHEGKKALKSMKQRKCPVSQNQ